MAWRMMAFDQMPGAGTRPEDEPACESPAPAPVDWRLECERQRARADAAEARCEELRLSNIDALSRAGSMKWHLGNCREKLEASRAEAKDLRRALRGSGSGIGTPRHAVNRAGSGNGAGEAGRLRGDLKAMKENCVALEREAGRLRKAVERAENEKGKAVKRAEGHKATIRMLNADVVRINRELRQQQSANRAIRVMSEHDKGKLKSRLAKVQAAGGSLSKLPFDQAAQLRTVLRRSRRQKRMIDRLRRENARLRRTEKGLRNRIAALEADVVRLRATGKVLAKRLFGCKSEQQKKSGTGRRRGQQRGASGHGRTNRPGIDERPEVHAPPPEACVCEHCGQPYAPNGVEESTLVEIEVKAHKRIIGRPRHRRTCACEASPAEVTAPPVPRLFRGSPYGITFWARFLFELCVCLRPVHRVAAWMSAHGLAVSPGTLADSLKRFVPLFRPLFEAILDHQDETFLRHADETSWRVRELAGEGRSSRAWLWTSVSRDAVCFHIDATRSAEAAEKLFAGIAPGTVIVCDRYSAYKKLVRMLDGLVILAFCWAHLRRDFVEAAAGQARLTKWCQEWIGRIAEVYRLNDERLVHYDPGRKRQKVAFRKATRRLKAALDALFAQAGRELAALPDDAREGKALRSLVNHREGLCVFVDRPHVPMDNNFAERILRGPAIARGLSHGSDSVQGAAFTATLYTVTGTLSMNGINVLRWLQAWLTECANNGGKPPDDLAPWLPWSMSEERRREFEAPP